jgi:hypothetical protein
LAVGYLVASVVIVLLGAMVIVLRFAGVNWDHGFGQVNLDQSLIAPDQRGGCTGQHDFADFQEGKRIRVSGANVDEFVELGAGHLSGGMCIFPFGFTVIAPSGRYTFDPGHGAERTVAAADLSRPVILTIGAAR